MNIRPPYTPPGQQGFAAAPPDLRSADPVVAQVAGEPVEMPIDVPIHHVCFSGAPWCSGCNPCPDCLHFVKENVLPSAMREARMSETAGTLLHLIGGLLANNIDPRQMGVQPELLPRTVEDQAQAFFFGYLQGWQRMHASMGRPEIKARLVARLVGPEEEGDMLQAPNFSPSESASSSPEPEAGNPEPAPLPPVVIGSVVNVPPSQRNGDAVRQRTELAEKERVMNTVKPLTVEEVMESSVPVPEEPPHS